MIRDKIAAAWQRWNRQPWWVRALFLFASGVFFWIEGSRIWSAGGLVGERYLVAKRVLNPGMVLTLDDLDVRLVTRGKDAPRSGFTDQELEHVKGATLLAPIAKGEFIRGEALQIKTPRFSSKVPKGYRAHLVSLEEDLPIVSGDLVDASLSIRGQVLSEPLLKGARVLTVRDAVDADGGQQVMLAVLPEDISALERAVQAGSIRLSIRNPDEPEGKRQARAKRKARVEVVEEQK